MNARKRRVVDWLDGHTELRVQNNGGNDEKGRKNESRGQKASAEKVEILHASQNHNFIALAPNPRALHRDEMRPQVTRYDKKQ
jgi:hypothetical protein